MFRKELEQLGVLLRFYVPIAARPPACLLHGVWQPSQSESS